MNWFRRKTIPPAPIVPALRGAPARARVKTYSAETGLVYQYVYRGWRNSPDQSGIDHVFEVSCGSERKFSIAVRLLFVELEVCEREIARTVLPPERYALAKLSLLAAFDCTSELPSAIVPTAQEMLAHLRVLGRL